MYRCPDCGGNLIYDISSHMLNCKYCDTFINPYSIEKESDGIELDTYEATIFTCPQCGGEILSTDDTAAGFCSYCGASTILTSRLSNELRPKWIAPFEVTKEECKNLYMKKMKRALFAPSDLKKPEYIESFRGIYMPYWKYKILQDKRLPLFAEISHSSGDYTYTDYYSLNMNINAEYDGFSFDASSSFYDNISESIAPFKVSGAKEFTPSMLSGFYGDIADVPKEIYENEAISKGCEVTYSNIKNVYGKSYVMDDAKNEKVIETAFRNTCTSTEGMMLPVWFMSYRNKNRVSYTTINGQTGKVVADIPIDPKKYIFLSLILAVPIFFILNLFFTLQPALLLKTASLFASITSIIYLLEIKSIHKKEINDGDIGLSRKKVKVKIKVKRKEKESIYNRIVTALLVICFAFPFILFAYKYFLWPLMVVITVVCTILGIKEHERNSSVKGEFGFFTSIIAVIIGIIISVESPVMDQYYYIGAAISILAVSITVISIIRNYNVLSSRKLPQFNKIGGDDRA